MFVDIITLAGLTRWILYKSIFGLATLCLFSNSLGLLSYRYWPSSLGPIHTGRAFIVMQNYHERGVQKWVKWHSAHSGLGVSADFGQCRGEIMSKTCYNHRHQEEFSLVFITGADNRHYVNQLIKNWMFLLIWPVFVWRMSHFNRTEQLYHGTVMVLRAWNASTRLLWCKQDATRLVWIWPYRTLNFNNDS